MVSQLELLLKQFTGECSRSRSSFLFSKRGMDDSQFHWLFVLMAGGFIIFLFAIFIGQGIAANQMKQTAQMLEYFDSVFSSSQNLDNLNQPIQSTSSITIEQTCEPGVDSKLSFVGQSLDKKIAYTSLFSAAKVSGSTYAIKTIPYNAPFHVDNPIFLTDDMTLYIIYTNDADIASKYEALLPSHATVVTTDDLSTITKRGFRDVVILSQSQDDFALEPDTVQKQLSPALRDNLRAVFVNTNTKNVFYSYGTKTANGFALFRPTDLHPGDDSIINSVDYTDDASLLGAIMSDAPTMYICNMQKLEARARMVALQIAVRATELEVVAGMDGRCIASYSAAHDQIMQGLQSPSNLLENFNWQDELASQNNFLITYSCPQLY